MNDREIIFESVQQIAERTKQDIIYSAMCLFDKMTEDEKKKYLTSDQSYRSARTLICASCFGYVCEFNIVEAIRKQVASVKRIFKKERYL